MKVIIKRIKIENFKGMLSNEFELSENKNIFEGENGVGKTTILDSITWCLFGKNFADEKLFKIKPIIDGEEKKDLVTSVEILLNDKIIKRTWENSSTALTVDGVKFGVKEFNDYLKDNFLITDEEFKSLSSIDYMANLNWKDLRSVVMSLIGEIKNEEIYTQSDFSLIKDKIESVGVEKTAEDIKTTKSESNNAIKKILGNIDQKTKDIEELVVDEKEQQEYEARREELKVKIDNANELKKKKMMQDADKEVLNQKEITLSRLNHVIAERTKDIEEYQKTYDNSNIDISIEKESKKKQVKFEIESNEKEIQRLELEKSTLIGERTELRKSYDDEVSKEIKIENDKCSSCGQQLPGEKIADVLNRLKLESAENANGYVSLAKTKKTRMDEIDVLIQMYKDGISEKELELDKIDNLQIDENQESDIQKLMKEKMISTEVNRENLIKDKDSIIKEIARLKETISNHEEIVLEDIHEMQKELEELQDKLAVSNTLAIFKQQLAELETEHQKLKDSKETLNTKEQQLIEFNNIKSKMLRDKVKGNFKLVDFITQEETKDGKLIETFKLAYNGIEYSALNHGQKILLSLDLIDNIQRLKDKRIPILIDGLAEVTRLPEVDTQVIGCRAKFQVNKKIEMVVE